MKNLGYMVRSLVGLLILVTLLFSCGGGQASSGSSKRDTLKINIGTEPPTLDWSLATDSTSYTILVNIMDGLTKFGASFIPEPALAEKWEISEDGKTYTFHLRKDVFWTDGKPLKAE